MRALCTSIPFLLLSQALVGQSALSEVDRLQVTGASFLLAGDTNASALNILRTDLANGASLDVREATGSMTILTEHDIEASGARTLEEALQLVPGFAIGRDVDDMTGVFIRGHWAQEGKCLFLLNGMPLNESSFGTYSLGFRMPLANVSRIEVINGSGSLLYGGFAALGVVNVITKDITDEEGDQVTVQYGVSNSRTSMRSLQVSGQHRTGPGTAITYNADLTMAPRSTVSMALADGTPMSFADSTMNLGMNAHVSLSRGGFKGQVYTSNTNSQVSDRSYDVEMRTTMLQAEQVLRRTERWQLSAIGNYRFQLPWTVHNDSTWLYTAINTIDQRIAGSLDLIAHPGARSVFRSKLSGHMDQSRFLSHTDGQVFSRTGTDRLTALDIAWANELTVRTGAGLFTGGMRAEHHSLSGNFLVPRFAYVGTLGRWHGKLMCSNAFKTPTFQNIDLAKEGGVRPETSRSYELELGYRGAEHLEVVATLFRSELKDPIVYLYTEEAGDAYTNRGGAATDGAELRTRFRTRDLHVLATASIYHADTAWSDLPETSLGEGAERAFLGAPRTKLALCAQWRPLQRISLQGAVIRSSQAWTYRSMPPGEELMALVPVPANLRMDLSLTYRSVRFDGFSVELGCRNMLDQRITALSGYDNGLLPLPFNGREWVVRLQYRII